MFIVGVSYNEVLNIFTLLPSEMVVKTLEQETESVKNSILFIIALQHILRTGCQDREYSFAEFFFLLFYFSF